MLTKPTNLQLMSLEFSHPHDISNHSVPRSSCCPPDTSSHPAQGMYPVVREDAAQMAALQMQAEHGPALAEDPEAFEASLEKVLTKQARPDAGHRTLAHPQRALSDCNATCYLRCDTAHGQLPCE